MTRFAEHFRAARSFAAAVIVLLSLGVESPRLFAQTIGPLPSVERVSPAVGLPAASPLAASAGLVPIPLTVAPSAAPSAFAVAAPVAAPVFAAAPVAERAPVPAVANEAAPSARRSLTAAHSGLAATKNEGESPDVLSRLFGERRDKGEVDAAVVRGAESPASAQLRLSAPTAGKTNDLIDPKNLAPLLDYDAETWTSETSFHAHSRFSDGDLSPTDLARRLASTGVLRDVALTDHDNVQGQEEFIRAARARGLRPHPGVELTGGDGIHIVVLDLDIYDAKLAALLRRAQEWRLARAKAYIAHLNELPELKDKGIVITIEEVLAKTLNGQIERPEIADVLIDKGLVKTKQEAFDKYIGFDIRTPDVVALEPKPAQVMAAVRSSGGRAFLAHPYTIAPGGPSIQDLLALGGLNIEGYRPAENATPKQAERTRARRTQYLLLAHDMNLLVMPGADFHGPSNPDLDHPGAPIPRILDAQLLKALEAPNKIALAKIDAKMKAEKIHETGYALAPVAKDNPDIWERVKSAAITLGLFAVLAGLFALIFLPAM